MDRHISDFEARESFPELIRDVQQGESFTVTVDGRPVARVTPVEQQVARSLDEVTERKRRSEAWRRTLERMAELPPRILPGWKREDLYER